MSTKLVLGRRRGRAARRSRGQALVEFAMFFVLTMFLIAGAVDMGGLLSDHVSLVYAAREGARTASVLSNKDPNVDCAIVGAVQAAVSTLPNVKVTQISIFQADANGQPVTSGGTVQQAVYPGTTTCTTTPGPAACNSAGSTYQLSQCPSPSNYPPSSRVNTMFTEQSIGVRIGYTYSFQIPVLFGGTFGAYDQAVMPANPISLPTPNGGGAAGPTPTPSPTPCPTSVIGPVVC